MGRPHCNMGANAAAQAVRCLCFAVARSAMPAAAAANKPPTCHSRRALQLNEDAVLGHLLHRAAHHLAIGKRWGRTRSRNGREEGSWCARRQEVTALTNKFDAEMIWQYETQQQPEPHTCPSSSDSRLGPTLRCRSVSSTLRTGGGHDACRSGDQTSSQEAHSSKARSSDSCTQHTGAGNVRLQGLFSKAAEGKGSTKGLPSTACPKTSH